MGRSAALKSIAATVLGSAALIACSPANAYTPLSLRNNLPSDQARHDWVVSHVTAAGTPGACQGDWSKMGTALGLCVEALHKQADDELNRGRYDEALEDLDNAKLAAVSSGGFAAEMSVQMDDRGYIAKKAPRLRSHG